MIENGRTAIDDHEEGEAVVEHIAPVQLPRAYATSFAVLSGSGEICAIVQPGRLVEIWNLTANQRVELWRIRSQPVNLLLAYDGSQFTVLCEDGYIGTIDHLHGPLKGTIRNSEPELLIGFKRPVRAEAARASKELSSQTGLGFVLSEDGRPLAQKSEVAAPVALAISNYGGLVAAADSFGHIKAWETRTWCTVHDGHLASSLVLDMAIQVTLEGTALLILSMAPDGAIKLTYEQLPGAVFAELDAFCKTWFTRVGRNFGTWVSEIEIRIVNLREEQAALAKEIAAERSRMVDSLVSLDQRTREKTRAIIARSAESLASTQARAWLQWCWQLAKENPLTQASTAIIAIAISTLAYAILSGAAHDIDLGALHFAKTLRTPHRKLVAGFTFVATAGLLVLLGRRWSILRAIRNTVRLATIAAMAGTVGIGVSEPQRINLLLAKYLHVHSALAWHQKLPYPIWLGGRSACIVTALGTFAKWLVRLIRNSQARQIAVGDALVQALVGIAYNLRLAADEPERAGDSTHRHQILDQIHLAARLAEREWVYAHRITHSAGFDSIQLQGYAIGYAIRRRSAEVALGGSGLQRAADAFAVAVADAAEGDWQALGADTASLPPLRRSRLVRVLANTAVLVLPVCAAVFLVVVGEKRFAAAAPTAYLLVSISAARLISMLHLGEDFDTGSKISEILHP